LWSISWRKISTGVKDNYYVIASEILRQGEPNQAYRHFAKTLPYSAASIKHGFERRGKNSRMSVNATSENGTQTTSPNEILLGYILLCSEMSMAKQISSVWSFSSPLLGVPLSMQTIQ
jgi:hypothetical protein